MWVKSCKKWYRGVNCGKTVQGVSSNKKGTGGNKNPVFGTDGKKSRFSYRGENNPDFRSGGYRNVPSYFLIK